MSETVLDKHTIIGLIATLPRHKSIVSRALPSMLAQLRQLDHIVIVSDCRELSAKEKATILSITGVTTPVTIVKNTRTTGAAGSWNTGITYINNLWPSAYLAILDDDDSWEPNHIAACVRELDYNPCCDVVLSGLRILRGIEIIENPLPEKIDVTDFLVGNPGWQGSNTFIKLSTLIQAGMFTESMRSTNDRDLAIRVLSMANISVRQTRQVTANWYCMERNDALSQPGNPKKLEGLAHFYVRHIKDLNNESIETQFFHRCKILFAFTQPQIIKAAAQYCSKDLAP